MTHESAIHAWSPAVRTRWTVTVADPKAQATTAASVLDAMDDAGLVALSASGRREAFDVIVERHRRTVYQVCYRFVNNHEDASDLSQEAFVRAWRGLKNFHGQSALSTWLYRIAVNLCLNRLSLKTPKTEPIESTDRFEDKSSDDPQSRLLREERAASVRKAIAALPRKQRATLILRAYHDLPHQQIAEILGSSVGAVKANFFHALANLRKRLDEQR
jgi:RNA polymerase sigma-70 factor (ECF subfamily)